MSGNKKIAKNSLILYSKMLISTFIGLWTSRIILNELGASDFGLYAVVGGVIALLNFLSTSMLATTFRFIAVELGKGENGNPNRVFNTSLVVHLILAFLILLIAETLGTYYIKFYLNIATNKVPDALFVLHFSMLATCITVISIPFQGLITAKEDFFISALINIIQAVLRFSVALSLIWVTGNKLRFFAVATALVIIINSLQFYFNCRKNYFEIIKWQINKKISDYKNIVSYNVWILVGTLAYIGRSQGTAIILNAFFGTLLNAAYGIANQLNGFIIHFAKNLNGAAVPQITKSYSSGDQSRSMSLVYSISKYSFFLMLLPVVPLLLSLERILSIWLKEVPVYTKEFVFVMLINGLLGSFSSGFDAAIQATGKIRTYQISYSLILLLSLLIGYFLFSIGLEPYTINIVFLIASIVNTIVGIYFMTKLTEFSFKQYLDKTVFKVFGVVLFIIPLFFVRIFFSDSLLSILIFSILAILIMMLIIYFIGLELSERKIINHLVKVANLWIVNRFLTKTK